MRLYNSCILLIILYGAETRSITMSLSKQIDTFDVWCLTCNASWMYIGQILSPMMRSVLILNNQPCPTPFIAVIFPFLVISAALTPGRIIIRLSTLALWDLLETGDGGLAGRQSWLRTIENDLRPLNIGLAATRNNGHVNDKLLNHDESWLLLWRLCIC